MRTSLIDILKVAFYLWRNPERKQLRICQMIGNATQADPYHIENNALVKALKKQT